MAKTTRSSSNQSWLSISTGIVSPTDENARGVFGAVWSDSSQGCVRRVSPPACRTLPGALIHRFPATCRLAVPASMLARDTGGLASHPG